MTATDPYDDIVLRLRAHANDADNWSDSYVGQRQAVWLRTFALAMRDAAYGMNKRCGLAVSPFLSPSIFQNGSVSRAASTRYLRAALWP